MGGHFGEAATEASVFEPFTSRVLSIAYMSQALVLDDTCVFNACCIPELEILNPEVAEVQTLNPTAEPVRDNATGGRWRLRIPGHRDSKQKHKDSQTLSCRMNPFNCVLARERQHPKGSIYTAIMDILWTVRSIKPL